MTQIAGASKGETGKTYGNILGCQRKLLNNENYFEELPVSGWYNGNNTGKDLRIVARFIKPENRERIVTAVLNACNNPHIGYDQKEPERFTLRKELMALPGGITPDNFGKVTNNCACDCSELVCLCIQAACGINFGQGTYTGSLAPENLAKSPFMKYSNVFQTLRITKSMYETGYGLIPGDIAVWRRYPSAGVSGAGHTAIVVTEDDSYIPPEISKQIVTGIVIDPPRYSIGKPKYKGQTKNFDLENTSGPLQIAWLDNDKIVYATKVIVVDKYGISHLIYGEDDVSILNTFIGDSRTLMLG